MTMMMNKKSLRGTPEYYRQINEGIALPKVLKTDDGRVLHISCWTPRAPVHGRLSVTVEAFIDAAPTHKEVPEEQRHDE